MSRAVCVVEVMEAAFSDLAKCDDLGFDPQVDFSSLSDAIDAVEKLIHCCKATERAFEAMSRADGELAQYAVKVEVVRALVAQRHARARAEGIEGVSA